MLPKADLERNKFQILLELAYSRDTSKNFPYESQKLLTTGTSTRNNISEFALQQFYQYDYLV